LFKANQKFQKHKNTQSTTEIAHQTLNPKLLLVSSCVQKRKEKKKKKKKKGPQLGIDTWHLIRELTIDTWT
jgi:hypothetical protein